MKTGLAVLLGFLFLQTVMGEDSLRALSTNETTAALSMHIKGKLCWTYNPTSAEGKPYFHPLNMPGSETPLTWHRPDDHTWHLGFWFSWKYINAVNFWEPDKNACAKVESSTVNYEEQTGIVRITTLLTYRAKGVLLLNENRLTTVTTEANGDYSINWDATFTAAQEKVTLSCTKPRQNKAGIWSSGGYAGLSWRFAPKDDVLTYAFQDANSRTSTTICGYESAWLESIVSNRLTGTSATVKMLNHPENPKDPVTWFLRNGNLSEQDKQGFIFMGPAPVFHTPLTITPDKPLRLRYRVTVKQRART